MSRRKFNNLVEKINKLNEKALATAILIMLLVLTAQIFSRFVYYIPLPSSQDLLIFFMLACVFQGAGIAVARGNHIAIEFLVNLLPGKIASKVMLFANFVSVTFLGVVIYQAIILISKTQGQFTGSSPIPVGVYYLIVAIGAFLMFINYINNIANEIYTAKSREEN